MDLTQNNKIIAIVAVIAIIATATLGIWYIQKPSDDNNESSDAQAIAEAFADTYRGNFGKYVIEDGATSDKAVVAMPTGVVQSPYARITFTTPDNISDKFNSLKEKLDTKGPVMGTPLVKMENVQGFDNVVAYRIDMSQSGIPFTTIYFAAYVDDILIDGSANPAYHPGLYATDESIALFFKIVSDAAHKTSTLNATDYARMFSEVYESALGPCPFNVGEDSNADTATAVGTKGTRGNAPVITFKIVNGSSTEFNALKEGLENLDIFGMGNVSPAEIEGIDGFDDVAAYKYDVDTPMAKFTKIHFAAYTGNVLVSCSADPLYHFDIIATDETVSAFFETLSDIIS